MHAWPGPSMLQAIVIATTAIRILITSRTDSDKFSFTNTSWSLRRRRILFPCGDGDITPHPGATQQACQRYMDPHRGELSERPPAALAALALALESNRESSIGIVDDTPRICRLMATTAPSRRLRPSARYQYRRSAARIPTRVPPAGLVLALTPVAILAA